VRSLFSGPRGQRFPMTWFLELCLRRNLNHSHWDLWKNPRQIGSFNVNMKPYIQLSAIMVFGKQPYFHQTSSIKIFRKIHIPLHNCNQGIWKTLHPSNKFNQRYFQKPYFHQTSSIQIFRKTLLPSKKFNQGISKNPPSIKQVQFKVFRRTLLPSNKCHQDL
jgi:hypothetical protein